MSTRKRQKALAENTAREQTGDTNLVSFTDVTAPKIEQSGPVGKGQFVYVDISSVDNELKRITEPKTLEVAAAPSRAKQRLCAGDVLVSMTRPNLNAVAMVPPELDGAVGSTGFHVLRANEGTEPRWLYYAVQTHHFISSMSELVQGALYPAVRPKDIRAFEIPHPPLDQQKRIVAEIERQFSRLDEAVANLKRVKANLKRYKAAVLKAAVEGRLVETEAELARREGRSLPTPRPGVFYIYAIKCDDDSIYIGHTDNLARRWEEHLAGQAADWTKQHKPIQIVHYEEYSSRQEAADQEKWLKTGYGRKWIKREVEAGRARQVGYETGAQLLQRILDTRRSQWKGKGKYKELPAPDTTDLPELPEGWVWSNFEAVAERVTVGHVGPMKDEYVEQGVPFLRSQNVRPNRYEPEGLKFISENFHLQLKKSRLQPGDIVVVRSGSVGVSCVVPKLLSEANCADLVIIKAPRAVLPHFGAYYMNSIVETRVAAGKVGIALTHFNTQSVAALPAPVPPMAEQQRIIAEVERQLSIASGVEAQLDGNLRRAARLRQSVLGSAFSGRVVVVDGEQLIRQCEKVAS